MCFSVNVSAIPPPLAQLMGNDKMSRVISLKGSTLSNKKLYIARLDESGIHSHGDQSSGIQMNQIDGMQPVDSSPHCDHRGHSHRICMMIWIQTRNMNKRTGWIEETNEKNENKASIISTLAHKKVEKSIVIWKPVCFHTCSLFELSLDFASQTIRQGTIPVVTNCLSYGT